MEKHQPGGDRVQKQRRVQEKDPALCKQPLDGSKRSDACVVRSPLKGEVRVRQPQSDHNDKRYDSPFEGFPYGLGRYPLDEKEVVEKHGDRQHGGVLLRRKCQRSAHSAQQAIGDPGLS